MSRPKLSVIMPVYNGESYLTEAIDSVLGQTFEDFELIIINDASSDGSAVIIESYTDSRIRILTNEKNKGIPYNRNLGLREAKGKFLCWTDCDDINILDRFQKQIHFLNNNSEYGGCGTWLSRFKGNETYYESKALKNPNEIKAALLFRPAAVPNATAMLRLESIKSLDIWYNTDLPVAEDYDFIFRCTRHLKFSNLQEVLYMYRDSETSIMSQFGTFDQKIFKINKKIYAFALCELGINASDDELYAHYMICTEKIFGSFDGFKNSVAWLKTINEANVTKHIYNQKALENIIADQFFFVTKKASKFGLKTLFFYVIESKKNGWRIDFTHLAKLTVRCLLKHSEFEFGRR